MEIKNLQSNFINTYKKVTSKNNISSDKVKSAETKKSNNFDKVEFDFNCALNAAKASISGSLDSEANSARLAELQQSYAGNFTPVSESDVAAAMLA